MTVNEHDKKELMYKLNNMRVLMVESSTKRANGMRRVEESLETDLVVHQSLHDTNAFRHALDLFRSTSIYFFVTNYLNGKQRNTHFTPFLFSTLM